MGVTENFSDKKTCVLCSGGLELTGNIGLADGEMCTECRKKLSPYFRITETMSAADILKHIAYREENAKALETFQPGRVFGETEKIYLDLTAQKLLVTAADDFHTGNPDIIAAEQIIECKKSIIEHEEECFFTDSDGILRRYDPPRFRHTYGFHITLRIDSPWFEEIHVELNPGSRPEREEDWYLECRMNMDELAVYIRKWTYVPRPQDNYLGPIPGYFENYTKRLAAQGIGMVPEKASPPDRPDVWICSCGTENNRNFCEECGRKRP